MEACGLQEEDLTSISATTLYGVQEGLAGPALRLSFPDLWEEKGFESVVLFTSWLDDRAYGLLGREPTFDYVGCRFGHHGGYGFYLNFLR